MSGKLLWAVVASMIIAGFATPAISVNKETIDTVPAYSGENGIRVDVFGRNEVGVLEYFNLIVFDDTKLDYVGIAADRGALWTTGPYPTQVVGNKIYVHGSGSPPSYCLPEDLGDPGSPLYHLTFNVKPGVDAGLASLYFSSEGAFDGHWNNCSGGQISPDPDCYDGGVNILGHAGHVTIGNDSASAGEQAAVDVYLHNDLDVFEYFHQILFEDLMADVDSIVALRGVLHYGNYPTHVSGDTIFVHGWAGSGGCFYEDPTYPGAALYRIYFTLAPWAPAGYTIPLAYLEESFLWNHWVGCDLNTSDSFDATDGSLYVTVATAAGGAPPGAQTRFGALIPNPTSGGALANYYLPAAGPVTVSVYDAGGRKIRNLETGPRSAGWHEVHWDGTDGAGRRIPSGIYFYRLHTASGTLGKKLVVIR